MLNAGRIAPACLPVGPQGEQDGRGGVPGVGRGLQARLGFLTFAQVTLRICIVASTVLKGAEYIISSHNPYLSVTPGSVTYLGESHECSSCFPS